MYRRRYFNGSFGGMFRFERRVLCNHTFFPSRVHAVSFPRFAFPPGSSPSFLYLPVPLFLFPHHLFSVRPRQPFTSARLRLLFPPPLFLLPARSPPASIPFFPAFLTTFPLRDPRRISFSFVVTDDPHPPFIGFPCPSFFPPSNFFSCISHF